MRIAPALLTLLTAVSLQIAGCIIIPLPSQGPKLDRIVLPATGAPATEVRQTLGAPNRLDVPNYLFYEWAVDRRFVIVPTMPTGIPAGILTDGSTYRLLIGMDRRGTVTTVRCSATELTDHEIAALPCAAQVGNLRTGVRRLFEYDIRQIAGLEDASFSHGGGNGATADQVLSPDGRLLAATDVLNRVWIIDLDQGAVVSRFDGEPFRFFAWTPPGEARAAFSADSRHMAVAQHHAHYTILDRQGEAFVPVSELKTGDVDVAQYAIDGSGVLGHSGGGVVRLVPTIAGKKETISSADLRFSAHGPVSVEPVAPADLMMASLKHSLLRPGLKALFGPEGRGLAVFDPRNAHVRNAGHGFAFSPDGQWLVRNSCRTLELWPSGGLVDLITGRRAVGTLSPSSVLLMPIAHDSTDERDGCYAPIAFRPDGKFVAAASNAVIHIWRLSDGEQVAVIGPLPLGFTIRPSEEPAGPDTSALSVQALAFGPDNRLTAIMSDYRHSVFAVAWQLPIHEDP
jgi:WD40 repeat protein